VWLLLLPPQRQYMFPWLHFASYKHRNTRVCVIRFTVQIPVVL
jgi:hypothetical protein